MKRNYLTRMVLVLAALAIGLAVAEVAGQGYYRIRNGGWLWQDEKFRTNQYIPYTVAVPDRREFALRPGYRRGPLLDHGRQFTISVDDRGFRTTVPAARPDQRVVVDIGDSVAFAAGISDELTYSSRLAELFQTKNLPLGVVNTGVASYDTQQSFDSLRMQVIRYYPPSQIAAVTFSAANDISLVFYYAAGYAPGLTWARDRNLVPLRPGWQRFASAYFLSKADDAYAKRRVPVPVSTESPEDRMLNHVRATLREELAWLRDRQIQVILLPINPFYYQLAHQEKNSNLRVLRELYKGKLAEMTLWDSLIRRYNDVLRDVALEFPNAQFLDTRAILDNEDRDVLYADYGHFTNLGNQRLAEILFEALNARGVVK